MQNLTCFEQPAQTKPSFQAFVQKILAHGEPLSQNTDLDNLGFGWIYYALVRNLRPEYVVAIGSRRGFMPFCAARAVQDNGQGKVLFIDPSYSGGGDPGWGGGELWNDPVEVAERIAFYGLTGWIMHLKMTSEEAFTHVKEMIGEPKPGVVIIDGAHTYENSLQDFELYSTLISEGFAVFHDSTTDWSEVWRTIHELRTRGFPMATIHREVGLTMVEIFRAPRVAETWSYLCSSSNRGELIFRYAREILRRGDQVLDIYCGCSPLASLAEGVRIFGCDRDSHIIEQLRKAFPQHRWEQIDELFLPFSVLPGHIDVLFGLGVSRGHAWWDPQRVIDNVRYLLGRYLPRACLFETAADYYNADILDDLRVSLLKLGYSCRSELIDTDMSSFSTRKLLIAECR